MTFTERRASAPPNFIYQDGSNVYVGQAAHCSGTGAQTETNGCDSGSLPIGTPVEVDRRQPARDAGLQLVAHRCRRWARPIPTPAPYNDLALVKLDPADVGKVNPSVPALRRPDRARQLGRGPRRHRLHLRQLVAARRRHQAEPEAGRRRPERGQRLEPHRLHGHPRNPRRLGQRIHGRHRRRRSACSARCRSPRSRPPTGSATCATSSTTCTRTARSAGVNLVNGTRAVQRRTSSARSSAARP